MFVRSPRRNCRQTSAPCAISLAVEGAVAQKYSHLCEGFDRFVTAQLMQAQPLGTRIPLPTPASSAPRWQTAGLAAAAADFAGGPSRRGRPRLADKIDRGGYWKI
jgi:hypothetical protein